LDSDDSTVDNAMKADEFYTKVGNWAAKSGVTVDVFGIQGDTCDIGKSFINGYFYILV
jgi:hypothetical protein